MTRKQIGLYIALAIAVSWGIQLPAILILGLDNELTQAIFVLVMWSPTILALLFIARSGSGRIGLRWRLGKLRYLPVGIAVETIIAFALLGIMVLIGAATSKCFSVAGANVSIACGPWVLGLGTQNWLIFLLNISATAIVFSVIGLIATTGEEFAWRGFLQSHLEQHCNRISAILVVAAVWWAWHLPGLLAGYNFPETPLLGALVLFPLQMLGASFFFGWLTIRAGSFWPAALAHATVNSLQQGIFDSLQLRDPVLTAHLIRTALILAVGILCWYDLRSAGEVRTDRPAP